MAAARVNGFVGGCRSACLPLQHPKFSQCQAFLQRKRLITVAGRLPERSSNRSNPTVHADLKTIMNNDVKAEELRRSRSFVEESSGRIEMLLLSDDGSSAEDYKRRAEFFTRIDEIFLADKTSQKSENDENGRAASGVAMISGEE